MKKLLIILLLSSLYMPTLYKWLAYSSCMVKAVAVNEKNWCDCTLSNTQKQPIHSENLPNTHKHINAELKFILHATKQLQHLSIINCSKVFTTDINFVLLLYSSKIFKPPNV